MISSFSWCLHFSFPPQLLSLYIFMDLSASPSICQSIHLLANICHFPCHLNHPSIRPSVFQATHSTHPSFIHPSILSIVHRDVVVTSLGWNMVTDLKWRTSRMVACSSSHRQGRTHLCVLKHTKPERMTLIFLEGMIVTCHLVGRDLKKKAIRGKTIYIYFDT